MINKEKVENTIYTILDTGLGLLKKEELTPVDDMKLKTMKSMGSFVNSAVLMAQQEVALERIVVIRERMAQLGYKEQKPEIAE